MSTCGICLKDFEVAVEKETFGHRVCVLEERRDRTWVLEGEIADLQGWLQREEYDAQSARQLNEELHSEISTLQEKLTLYE